MTLDLNGKTIVISGTIADMDRVEATLLAEEEGARVVSAISAKVDMLIVGERPGQNKIAAARKLNIPIVPAVEWLGWEEQHA
jgi:DNA ligase (NAD+)